MVDILPGGTRKPEPPRPATPEPRARTKIETAPGNATPIRKNGGAYQNEGRFFRGLVIFLAISVVFWAIVIALFHFL